MRSDMSERSVLASTSGNIKMAYLMAQRHFAVLFASDTTCGFENAMMIHVLTRGVCRPDEDVAVVTADI